MEPDIIHIFLLPFTSLWSFHCTGWDCCCCPQDDMACPHFDLLCVLGSHCHRVGLCSQQNSKLQHGANWAPQPWRYIWWRPNVFHVCYLPFACDWTYCYFGIQDFWWSPDWEAALCIHAAIPSKGCHTLSLCSSFCLSYTFIQRERALQVQPFTGHAQHPPLADLPNQDTLQNALLGWCAHYRHSHTASQLNCGVILNYPAVYQIAQPPIVLDNLFGGCDKAMKCSWCKTIPVDAAICLICGTTCCFQSHCCTDIEANQRGEYNMHTQE